MPDNHSEDEQLRLENALGERVARFLNEDAAMWSAMRKLQFMGKDEIVLRFALDGTFTGGPFESRVTDYDREMLAAIDKACR